MDDQDNIADPGAPSNNSNQASVLMNLERLIKSHIASIDKLTQDLAEYRQMLEDIFNNDSTYKDHLEKAKEAAKIKTATKQQILKQPQPANLANKVKSMGSELKELKNALSDYLKEFQRMSGLNEIEGEDGEIREIVYTAKLIKKSFKI